MSTILVFYEGIMQNRRQQPIRDGFLLVHGLVVTNRIVIASNHNREYVEHQLRTEKLGDQIAEIIDSSAALPPLPLWHRQIEKARSRWNVDIIMASDPDIIEYSVGHGVVGLFFAHPGFNRPPQRPEQGQRSWDALRQEMEARL